MNTNDVLDAIGDGTKSIQAIYQSLNANTIRQKHDVRNALQRLYNSQRVERPKKGFYRSLVEIFRHYVSTLLYCSGKTRSVYALSFKQDEDSIFNELVDAIKSEYGEDCGNAGMGDIEVDNSGYEITETDEGMNSSNTYPEIEVGRL